jgi:hypothetical protein
MADILILTSLFQTLVPLELRAQCWDNAPILSHPLLAELPEFLRTIFRPIADLLVSDETFDVKDLLDLHDTRYLITTLSFFIEAIHTSTFDSVLTFAVRSLPKELKVRFEI